MANARTEPVIATDPTSRTIPIIHVVGVIALFTGPFFSETGDDGVTTSAGLSTYRDWMRLFGDEWMLYSSLVAIAIAVAAAVLIRPSAIRVRLPLIVLGSLAGLTLPIVFFIHYGNGIPATTYFATWGWGLLAYSGACVSAAIVAVAFAWPDRDQTEIP